MPPDTPAPLPDDWEHQDAVGCYLLAVAEIGKRVKAGEEVPEFFRSSRETEGNRDLG